MSFTDLIPEPHATISDLESRIDELERENLAMLEKIVTLRGELALSESRLAEARTEVARCH